MAYLGHIDGCIQMSTVNFRSSGLTTLCALSAIAFRLERSERGGLRPRRDCQTVPLIAAAVLTS
jgi:hypothetical protein